MLLQRPTFKKIVSLINMHERYSKKRQIIHLVESVALSYVTALQHGKLDYLLIGKLRRYQSSRASDIEIFYFGTSSPGYKTDQYLQIVRPPYICPRKNDSRGYYQAIFLLQVLKLFRVILPRLHWKYQHKEMRKALNQIDFKWLMLHV